MAAFTPFLLLLLVFCSFLPSQAQHLNLRPHPINQTLGITNLFAAQQRVTDSTGAVPLRYQPALLDPQGRFFEIELRKLF